MNLKHEGNHLGLTQHFNKIMGGIKDEKENFSVRITYYRLDCIIF